MTEFVGAEKPSLEELAHHGVKGMKWGQHKAPGSKPSTEQIKDARVRQFSRLANVNAQAHKLNLATGKQKDVEAKKYVKLHNDFQTNKDAAVAARMTKGEKAANLILAGPFGAIAIAANAHSVKKLESIQKK